uniref:NAD(P)(+)--arginine ADP-ribosyltransferase n=1 Tax=Dicentrarchus labrax TaxID=13489 RepID=A0A8P4GI08_DICLA
MNRIPLFRLPCRKLQTLKLSGASALDPSGRFRIPLNLSPDCVDMYYGCSQKMLIKVKRHYLPRSTRAGLSSTYTQLCALKAMKNKDIYDPLSWDHFRGKAFYKTSFEVHALHFLLSDSIRLLKLNQRSCYTIYRRSKLLFSGEPGQTIRFGSFASSSLGKDLRQFGRITCFEIQFDSVDEVLIPPYEMFNIVPVDSSGESDLHCGGLQLNQHFFYKNF